MDTLDLSAIRAALKHSTAITRIPVNQIGLLTLFVFIGSFATLFPFLAVGCFVAIAILAFGWLAIRYVRHTAPEMWQVLLLIALAGYTILNHGFENLTIHAGVPIIVSYAVVFTSLILAAYSHPQWMIKAREEPAILCLLSLLLMTLLHLVFDIPSYGMWAIRDASMFIDGIFLVLGLLWAMKGESTMPLMKWLMVLFFLNLVYSSSLPWGDKISAWSPQSGVFLQVPILGSYSGCGMYLLLGALFYLSLSSYVVKCPRSIILFLVAAQLFGLTILQARAMYVGFAAVLIIFVFLGESGKSGKLLFMLMPALAGVLLLTTLGIELPGRIGVVSLDFLKEHVRSLSGAEDTPGSKGRSDWYEEALDHFRKHPVLGDGFGMVLIDFNDWDHSGNAAVRQPHNSSISVLARLGVVGSVPWVILHVYVWKRFLYALRHRRYCAKQLADLIVWLFMVYVVYMINASVEAGFEFPSGAIPFYFFLGLALGLIRYQLPQQQARATAARYVGCTGFS